MATSDGAMKPGAIERLRDFSAALRQGNAQAALAAARDACLAEPNMAEAHYASGQAWIAAGKPARAEQAFATAIRLRPNLGLARYSQGRSSTPSARCWARCRRSPAIPRRPPIWPSSCA